MKPNLAKLKPGQVVEAEVAELLSATEFIASFAGDLIRAANLTQETLFPGQKIKLKVKTVRPLSFQLMGKARSFDRTI